ncbi:nucleotidyltransferase domain-containing protein [Candidatus Woesearchaeota archaeon]|nr:nucleotidyltransferase domain-containing protein [Candidatus Woesearchaeota archaeon]
MKFDEVVLSEDARVIFGKKEQEIIRLQKRGEKLTQSQKNILSRSIRKKLKLISKLSNYKENFNLEHASEIKKIIRETKQELIQHKEIIGAYLFGSYATGEYRENSDVDIAILLKQKFKPKKFYLSKLSNKLEKNIGKEVQIVIINNAGLRLKNQILKYGKLIFSKKDLKEYENITMKKYTDFKYYLNQYDKERVIT